MKKIMTLFVFLIGFNANAGLLNINLSSETVTQGDTLTVTLIASDFAGFGFFNLLFDFDHSLFALDLSPVASDLNILDPFSVFEANQVTSGLALSYLGFELIKGDFLLASFTLSALKTGISDFSFSLPAADGGFFYGLDNTPLEHIDITATALATTTAAVPEPSSLALLCIALTTLIWLRR